MTERIKPIIRMIEKIDNPKKLFLGESLLERVRKNLTKEEIHEVELALEYQFFIIYLFI